MNDASRTAGCPAAERNALTEPTGGASPIFTSVEVKSPLAQLRQQGRAVPLKRRRKVRDDFLGREEKPSQSLLRKVQRQTLYTCLVQLAREVDARILERIAAPVSRASSQLCREKNWIIQFSSGVRPLDFRDHIPVMPLCSRGEMEQLKHLIRVQVTVDRDKFTRCTASRADFLIRVCTPIKQKPN